MMCNFSEDGKMEHRQRSVIPQISLSLCLCVSMVQN